MKVRVFDIQRYSVQDGPGIRTTVFLKGCNLRCAWCENPESIAMSPQISYAKARCIECRSCERVCPHGAIGIGTGYPIDKARCDTCGRCVSTCPTNALGSVGIWRDVDDVAAELLHDRDYWLASGGGVTISGGEATLQVEGLEELLAALRRESIHTVLQTNGNLSWEKLEHLAKNVSLFHFDLKGIDDPRHRINTGVGNGRILANTKRLSEGGYPVVFRVPLVPGYNDSPDDLSRLREFLDTINAQAVDVLPYHNLGERKLDLTGMADNKLALASMSRAEAVERARMLASAGCLVTVSGENLPILKVAEPT